jgi:hypothetical protein
MNFPTDDLYMPLDPMSDLFKDNPDILSNQDSQFPYSSDPLVNPVDDASGNGMQTAFGYSNDPFLDLASKSTILEDQIPQTLEAVNQEIQLPSAPTFEHSEEPDQDEYIRSIFTSVGGSKFPTPFDEMACPSPGSPAELKYTEDDGVEWDPRDNAQLELDGDEIFRRRSIDTVTGPPPSAGQDTIVSSRTPYKSNAPQANCARAEE